MVHIFCIPCYILKGFYKKGLARRSGKDMILTRRLVHVIMPSSIARPYRYRCLTAVSTFGPAPGISSSEFRSTISFTHILTLKLY